MNTVGLQSAHRLLDVNRQAVVHNGYNSALAMNAAAFNVESNSDVDSDLLIVGRMSHLAGIC